RWMHILGAGTIDDRLMGMPWFSGIRHFKTGISSFINSQWTGTESKAVAKVFLPMIAGSQPPEAVAATRCIMDFMYRAHLPQLDDNDLNKLDADLAQFHELKGIFVTHGGVKDWDAIPKIHMLGHYSYLIREFGTTNGYNTETSERLHIDYVKVFYCTSNKVDPIEQMITTLQRQEAWAIQHVWLEGQGVIPGHRRKLRPGEEEFEGTEDVEGDRGDVGDKESIPDDEDEGVNGWGEERHAEAGEDGEELVALPSRRKQCHDQDEYHPHPTVIHAKRPTKPSVSGRDIIRHHEAPDFITAIRRYVAQFPNADEHT
ncbi:hypothetical protein FRC06_005364, partial [Ceratobasidium sp. 370]